MSEWEGLLRLAAAAAVGGVIGFERETADKSAGLRTHMLVCLGAAMFMVGSILIVYDFNEGPDVSKVDPTRIASTIVTGIGFLGGGIIIQNNRRAQGVTTAAGLWVAAAIGMVIGAGFYITGIGGGILTMIILFLVRRIQHWLELKGHSTRHQSLPDE